MAKLDRGSSLAQTWHARSDLVAAVGNDRILNWLPNLRIGGAVSDGPSLAGHKDPALARYYADGTQWSMRVIQAD